MYIYREKLPDCLCNNGDKALYVCLDENCEHLKKLTSRLSKERYYCEECMNKLHDHRPIDIIKKTFEVGQKWLDLDTTLINIEKEFRQNMHEYMDLISHYENFAENHNIEIKSGILSQLRDLDKVKEEFNYEAKEKENESILDLVDKFQVLELLEIKEPLRIAFEQKIISLAKLAMIDEKAIGQIYKEVIEKDGHESDDHLYKQPNTKQSNKDMYLRLKLQSFNDLRKQDAEKIMNLENKVQEILERLSKIDGKK